MVFFCRRVWIPGTKPVSSQSSWSPATSTTTLPAQQQLSSISTVIFTTAATTTAWDPTGIAKTELKHEQGTIFAGVYAKKTATAATTANAAAAAATTTTTNAAAL